MATLEARLIMRVVGSFVWESRKGLLIACLLRFLPQTTFLHLALIAVFVFVKTLVKLILSLSLHETDSIFVK